MNATRPRFALVRGGVFGALALVAVLAACEAKMPTSADVDQMDAASAERTATKLALIETDKGPQYIVDGVKTDAATAKRIAALDIATIEVKKARDNEQGLIAIRTKSGSATGSNDTLRIRELKKTADAIVTTRDSGGLIRTNMAKVGGKEPLVYIDGVKLLTGIKNAGLDPKDIESIEVLKGAAAATYVNDPDAANGVIVITTKAAAAKKK